MKIKLKNHFFLFLIISTFVSFTCNICFADSRRKYNLIYFKYAPQNLKIKIYPYDKNILSEEDDSGHIITKKIGNGEAKFFLASHVPMERDWNVKYEYKVVFFKTTAYNDIEVDIPVYSIIIRSKSESVDVRYEPVSAIPLAVKTNDFKKTFYSYPNTCKYHIKNFDGLDFHLTPMLKTVQFSGKLKVGDDYVDLPAEKEVRIGLLKMEKHKIPGKKNDNNSIIKVPLKQNITVGLWPYRLTNFSSKRYTLTGIMVKGAEKNNLTINFAELWKNQSRQTLIFEDKKNYLSVHFNDDLFNIKYMTFENEIQKSTKSPLEIYLPDYKGKTLMLYSGAHSLEKQYLREDKRRIEIKIPEDTDTVTTAKKLTSRYPQLRPHKIPGHIYLKPVYKTTPFAIFTKPENVSIRFKRVFFSEKTSAEGWEIPGNSPIFYDVFPYGIYLLEADYYEMDDKTQNEVLYHQKLYFEVSDTKPKPFLLPLKVLSKKQSKIPYIEFNIKKTYPYAGKQTVKKMLGMYISEETGVKTHYIVLKEFKTLPIYSKVNPLKHHRDQIKQIYKKIKNTENIRYALATQGSQQRLLMLYGPYRKETAYFACEEIKKDIPDAAVLARKKNWKFINR